MSAASEEISSLAAVLRPPPAKICLRWRPFLCRPPAKTYLSWRYITASEVLHFHWSFLCGSCDFRQRKPKMAAIKEGFRSSDSHPCTNSVQKRINLGQNVTYPQIINLDKSLSRFIIPGYITFYLYPDLLSQVDSF